MKLKSLILSLIISYCGIFSITETAVAFGFSHGSNINPYVYNLALKAYHNAINDGSVRVSRHIMTIIDYSKPSQEPRLWVVNMDSNKILMETLVAHGQGSGQNTPDHFSDAPRSLASSVGLYVTEGTYEGKHGYSLRLRGLERGFNDKAESRGIVMHSAWYVSNDMVRKYGRLGRSWGCPAVDEKISKPLINTIKNGTLVFAYGQDSRWLHQSAFLNHQVNRG